MVVLYPFLLMLGKHIANLGALEQRWLAIEMEAMLRTMGFYISEVMAPERLLDHSLVPDQRVSLPFLPMP